MRGLCNVFPPPLLHLPWKPSSVVLFSSNFISRPSSVILLLLLAPRSLFSFHLAACQVGNGGIKACFTVVDVSISPDQWMDLKPSFFFQVKERPKFQVYLNTRGYRVCGKHLRLQCRRIAWQRQIGADSCDIIFSQYDTEMCNVQYFHSDIILSLIVRGFVFFRFKILRKQENSINVYLLFSYPSEW